MTALRRSSFIVQPLLLASMLAACGVDTPPAGEQTVHDDHDPVVQGDVDEVARLEAELAKLPGRLLITRSSDLPFSPELERDVETADKIIHVYASGRVAAYLGAPAAPLPDDVEPFRLFRELHGDITIANQELLAEYLQQQEGKRGGVAEAVGLAIGDGALWPDSTVAYVIDGSISNPAELEAVKRAITTWNRATDPLGNPMRVRFVPRYPNDSRPYVSFVRGGSGGCGSSQVGRHDNIFTNWWSHNIHIDCFDQLTILHEMGHTAGLYHEQQRCDRDNYVAVGAPGGINCERYCGGYRVDYGPYNYLSMMHYPYNNACSIRQITPTASSFRGNPWDVFTRGTIDSFDVQAINTMYRDRPALPPIGSHRFYTLRPQHTSRVVIVPGGSTTNATTLVLWDRIPGFFDQEFSLVDVGEGYVELRPRHAPAKCVEIYGFSTANGGAVMQWDCWGGTNQQWIVAPTSGVPGSFDIINRHSAKSLDVPGSGTANGTPMHQWDHHRGANQQFALAPGV